MGRHLQISCMGYDREAILALAFACIDAARPDDCFDFMLDASSTYDKVHETAVTIETFWYDEPSMGLAHLTDQRHVLLLGADIVLDMTGLTTGPCIEDQHADDRARQELQLDMSLLCPHADLITLTADDDLGRIAHAAVAAALKRAERTPAPHRREGPFSVMAHHAPSARL